MNVIFDLDGTIIDSSESILSSFQMAFEQLNIPLTIPLTSELIGPPLGSVLEMLSGSQDPDLLMALRHGFINSYDSEGLKKTVLYPQMRDVLQALYDQNFSLFIATNKREVPTKKIINNLSLSDFFTGVYSLDSYANPANKTELMSKIIQLHQLTRQDTIYIGDTIADYHAAENNQLDYVMVTWGYGDEDGYELQRVHTPEALVDSLVERLLKDVGDRV